MKIILIDDEPLILEELSYLCEKHKDIEICGKFVNPKQALQYVAGHRWILHFVVSGCRGHGTGTAGSDAQRKTGSSGSVCHSI